MAADGEGMDQERACVAVRDIIQDLPRDLLGIGGPGDVDGSRHDTSTSNLELKNIQN